MNSPASTTDTSSRGPDMPLSPAGNSAATTHPKAASKYQNFSLDTQNPAMTANPTKLNGSDSLTQAKDTLSSGAGAVKSAVEQRASTLAKRTRRNAKIADRYVHARAWQWIGISASLALLLGVLVGRRK